MITLTLTTEEADALHDALSLAHMERINQMVPTNDPRLAVLTRVIELIEAETVEGMIERGEIEQGALATGNPSFPCDDCENATPVSEHCGGPTDDAGRLDCQATGEDVYLCEDCYGSRREKEAEAINACAVCGPDDHSCAVCDPEEPRTFTHRIS